VSPSATSGGGAGGGAAAATAAAATAAAAAASAAAAAATASANAGGGWRDSLYRVVRGTSTNLHSNLRFAVYGSKHDASTFEELLRHVCDIRKLVGRRAAASTGLCGRGRPKGPVSLHTKPTVQPSRQPATVSSATWSGPKAS
jgi:hypothetical protein